MTWTGFSIGEILIRVTVYLHTILQRQAGGETSQGIMATLKPGSTVGELLREMGIGLEPDALLLVVRAGKVNREMVARHLEAVGRDKLLGVVFNAVEPGPASSYKYYYKSAYRYHRD